MKMGLIEERQPQMTEQKFSKETPALRQELQALRGLAGLPTPAEEARSRGLVPDAEPVALAGQESDLFNERQIDTWDLVDISYLERGTTVARAVGKLHGRDAAGPYVGTAFLVSERLLVTNHHNLPDETMAAAAFVEFEHELGPDGLPRAAQRFTLKPDEAYWSDPALDVCVVAVAPVSQGNIPLTRYGYLRLNPVVGKIQEGQFISLIHHPDGEWKQVSLRENRLLKKDELVLWYASDTAPGTSGAPCFSDQWQVVAVHRRGVPQTDENNVNRIALRNGQYMTREQIRELRISDRDILWVANEGTRVSVFINTIRQDPLATDNALIAAWMADLGPPRFSSEPARPPTIVESAVFEENRRPDTDYERRNGYQPDFLGIAIPPPGLDEALRRWGRAAFNSDTGEPELPYYNFSLWMSRERRLAFVAAVNIDGANHNARDRAEFGDDKWDYDDRLPERLQIGDWFYGNEPARYGRNYFDRGHVVRRTEPSWGPTATAQLANDDTFHWTNCSPQYKLFNQRSRYWQGLETYLLENGAVRHSRRLTLFTGPIFSDDDTEHRTVWVPKQFFKVAVFVGQAGQLQSAAYVLDQSQWVEVIDFERAPALDIRTVRRSIGWLEEKTGLDFGQAVREADAAGGLGSELAAISGLPDLFG